MKDTKPFFIVSSGRSGTQLIEKLMKSFEDVEMHHEYLCEYIQPLAVKYYLGITTEKDAIKEIEKLHASSVFFSKKRYWGDSSNKLSWLIPVLSKVFPDSKFIHLVRDGRKVVSSFYHKLGEECYDDQSTKTLQAWVDNPMKHRQPPPEKKYWWNVLAKNNPNRRSFLEYNQFQRICFHWHEVNSIIEKDLATINSSNKFTVRLEDLVSDELVLKNMLDYLDLPHSSKLFDLIKKPHNVHVPINYSLTDEQLDQFNQICSPLMKKYNYLNDGDYQVGYDNGNPIEYKV